MNRQENNLSSQTHYANQDLSPKYAPSSHQVKALKVQPYQVQTPISANVFSPLEPRRQVGSDTGNQNSNLTFNNYSSIWNKAITSAQDNKGSSSTSQRKYVGSVGTPQVKTPSTMNDSLIRPLEAPQFQMQNNRAKLSFHKNMVNQIVNKKQQYKMRRKLGNIEEEKSENIIRYDMSAQNKRMGPLKFSYQEDESDLDRWKNFRNKSLLEILNNNKKLVQSDIGTPDLHSSQVSKLNYANNKNFNNLFKTNALSVRISQNNSVTPDSRGGAAQGEYHHHSMLQVERDLKLMKNSIKKLQRQSMDQRQMQKLKDIDLMVDKQYEQAYFSEMGDEYAQKEKQVQNMLNEVKHKTDLYRKKKLNNMFNGKVQKKHSQTPRIEEQIEENNDKNSIDMNMVKKFLECQQNAVGYIGQDQEGTFYKTQNREIDNKQNLNMKTLKLSLRQEYKNHLYAVSKLQHFSSLKMYLDHSFYQTFMPAELIKNQNLNPDESKLEEYLANKNSKSTVLPSVHSYLEPQQEDLIPEEPILLEAHKTIVALFHECQNFLAQYIKKKDIITIKQEENEVSLTVLRQFFYEIFQMFQQLMKVHSQSNQDVATALVLDQLFKIIMIKIDDIFANNQRVINQAIELQKFQVKQLKQEAEYEIETREHQIQLLKQQHLEALALFKEKLELAQKEKQHYKELFQNSEAELANLTNFEKRTQHIEDLKDSYNQINQFILEAEDEKIKQMKILEQYS